MQPLGPWWIPRSEAGWGSGSQGSSSEQSWRSELRPPPQSTQGCFLVCSLHPVRSHPLGFQRVWKIRRGPQNLAEIPLGPRATSPAWALRPQALALVRVPGSPDAEPEACCPLPGTLPHAPSCLHSPRDSVAWKERPGFEAPVLLFVLWSPRQELAGGQETGWGSANVWQPPPRFWVFPWGAGVLFSLPWTLSCRLGSWGSSWLICHTHGWGEGRHPWVGSPPLGLSL